MTMIEKTIINTLSNVLIPLKYIYKDEFFYKYIPDAELLIKIEYLYEPYIGDNFSIMIGCSAVCEGITLNKYLERDQVTELMVLGMDNLYSVERYADMFGRDNYDNFNVDPVTLRPKRYNVKGIHDRMQYNISMLCETFLKDFDAIHSLEDYYLFLCKMNDAYDDLSSARSNEGHFNICCKLGRYDIAAKMILKTYNLRSMLTGYERITDGLTLGIDDLLGEWYENTYRFYRKRWVMENEKKFIERIAERILDNNDIIEERINRAECMSMEAISKHLFW